MSTIIGKLSEIQKGLNAPKGQFNKFGGYSYRSCEDILQAVKPLLNGLAITITDDIKVVGDRVYVMATATLTDGSESVSATAYAREPASAKGKDDSQITGSTSSYARKYALNGLLLIDDNRDADSMDNSDSGQQKRQQAEPPKPEAVVAAIKAAKTRQDVDKYVQTARQRGVNDAGMETINEAAVQRIGELEEA